jgi:hypothetical protein
MLLMQVPLIDLVLGAALAPALALALELALELTSSPD